MYLLFKFINTLIFMLYKIITICIQKICMDTIKYEVGF